MTTQLPRPRITFPLLVLVLLPVAVALGVGIFLATLPRPVPDRPAPATPGPDLVNGALSDGPVWFQDMTAMSGVDFTYRNGVEAKEETILETLGGGVALLDYDGDGLLDLFFPGGGTLAGKQVKGLPCRLFRNLGGWKFKDVTAEAGLDRVSWWYTHGAAVADFDRDGWPDLLVTGYGRLALFRNVSDGKGGRRFVDVTAEVGLKDDQWSTSAGWADLDGDGYPDLYVCRYGDWSFANNPHCPGQRPGAKRDTCPPFRFRPLPHSLFRNNKGKDFRDLFTEQSLKSDGYGLGVVLADLNGDARPDVYVANDTTKNYLYFNRGTQLEDRGVETGAAVDEGGRPNGSMGVDVGDFEGTGRPSIFVTNFQREVHALYRNLGKDLYRHHSRAAGVASIGQHWVGFGTAFIDVDGDGWEDLIIVNGHVYNSLADQERLQRPILLANVSSAGGRSFRRRARGGSFFDVPALGRGLAVGDLDNDGWPDVVVSHMNSPVALLRNVAASGTESPHHWLGLRLVGRDRRDVVGSTVVAELEDGRKLTRFAKGGGSYLSASDTRLLFGPGTASKIRRLTVRWSWGKEQSWDGGALGTDRYWDLLEGEDRPRPSPAPAR